MYLIVVYDISDVKLQGHVRNFIRRYLSHIQLSVFEGEVNPSQFAEIKKFFKELKLSERDGIIIYILRTRNKIERITFGEEAPNNDVAYYID